MPGTDIEAEGGSVGDAVGEGDDVITGLLAGVVVVGAELSGAPTAISQR